MPRAALVATLPAPVAVVLVMAWSALDENSGTYDEPFLVTAGYTHLTRGDFRLNTEHPPLVKGLLALPLLTLPLHVGSDGEPAFAIALANPDAQFVVGDRFFYRDNGPRPLLRRARMVSLALAAILVLLVGVWAHAAFGILGGGVAATLAGLDPNLLAQDTQATTDLGFALFFIVALLAVRRTFRALGPDTPLAAGVASRSAAQFPTRRLGRSARRHRTDVPRRTPTLRRTITSARPTGPYKPPMLSRSHYR